MKRQEEQPPVNLDASQLKAKEAEIAEVDALLQELQHVNEFWTELDGPEFSR